MSEQRTAHPSATGLGTSQPAPGKPGLSNVVVSEFTKITSVRSFRAILLSTPLIAALTAVICGTTLPQTTEKSLDEYAPVDQLAAFLYGTYAIAILMFAFSALVVSSEYSSKTSTTTLVVTPRRGRVFVAKVIVIAALSAIVGLVAVVVCVLVGTGVTGGQMNVIGDGLLRNAFWFALQPVFYSVLAALIAVVFRSVAWAISITGAVFAILPAFLNAMPDGVESLLKPITPVAALHSIAGTPVPGSSEDIGAYGGVAVLVVWIAVFALWAWRRLSRDDA